jgi:hypothetical protein
VKPNPEHDLGQAKIVHRNGKIVKAGLSGKSLYLKGGRL